MLRSRIYTTEIVPLLDPEMVKVSAKRMTLVPEKNWDGVAVTFDGVIPVRKISGPLYEKDRVVSAEILDQDGKIIAQAMNHNGINRTLHAEVICIQNYWRENKKPIQRGAVIRTSLSPCRQCAAMISVCAEEGSEIRVESLTLDPGKLAVTTLSNLVIQK